MCGRFTQYRTAWEYLEPLRLDLPLASSRTAIRGWWIYTIGDPS